MKIWGLTGGIASGKSAVARILLDEGIAVLDADQIARELRAPGALAHSALESRFGTADSDELKRIVFDDSAARAEIEAILHPLIQAESLKRARALADAAGNPPGFLVIYEAALLVETGRYRDLDGLIVVEAPPELRRSRLIARDSSTAELADKILASQTSDEARRTVADHVIINHGTLDELRSQVKSVLAKIRLSS